MTAAPAMFVNVLEVDPERQQELVDLATDGVREVIRHRPGFLSATVLAAADGRRVVICARWRSAEDAKRTQADPAAAEHARRLASIATPGPGLYRVAADVR